MSQSLHLRYLDVVNPGNGHERMTNVRHIDVGNDGPWVADNDQ
jgi:hypothetical protein